MGPWWLYLLVFVFGLHDVSNILLFKIDTPQLIADQIFTDNLFVLWHKAVEHLSVIKPMVEGDNTIPDDLQQKIDEQISILKNNSINYLINMHPKFYRESLI